MMNGMVIRRQATLPVIFRLSAQPDFTLEFVIDTGFSGFLTLPSKAVKAMQLPFDHEQFASLADGSFTRMALHSATILWNGDEQQVGVVATGRRPLLGTALLDDQELHVQFRERGLVSVEEL